MITADKILASVAAEYGVTPQEIIHGGRSRRFSDPRAVCQYLMRELGWTYHRIAELFDHINHSTATKNCQKVEHTPKLLAMASKIQRRHDRKAFHLEEITALMDNWLVEWYGGNPKDLDHEAEMRWLRDNGLMRRFLEHAFSSVE